MATHDDHATRVARGAKWLDIHAPGWEERVKIGGDALKMSDPCRCVLGHVFAAEALDRGKSNGYALVVPYGGDGRLTKGAATSLGFDAINADEWSAVQLDYDDLGRAWRALIRERRAAKAATS